jgi:hypothetical protein
MFVTLHEAMFQNRMDYYKSKQKNRVMPIVGGTLAGGAVGGGISGYNTYKQFKQPFTDAIGNVAKASGIEHGKINKALRGEVAKHLATGSLRDKKSLPALLKRTYLSGKSGSGARATINRARSHGKLLDKMEEIGKGTLKATGKRGAFNTATKTAISDASSIVSRMGHTAVGNLKGGLKTGAIVGGLAGGALAVKRHLGNEPWNRKVGKIKKARDTFSKIKKLKNRLSPRGIG